MKHNTPFLLVAVLLLGVSVACADGELPYWTSFSGEEGFFPGAAPAADGWIVDPQGTVVVTEDYVKAGQSVLAYRGDPPGFLRRGFATGGRNAELLFLDVFVRPAISGGEVSENSLVFFDTIGLGFVREPGGETATVAVRTLGEDRRLEWRDLQYPVATDSLGRASEWLRVSFRVDVAEGHFDVFLDSELQEHSLGFRPSRFGSAGRNVRLSGARAAETGFDDLYVGEREHPVFEDAGGSGLPADWLAARGLDPEDPFAREAALEDGRTAIEAFLAETRPDYVADARRGAALERDLKPLPERRLTVFTPLETVPPELEALLEEQRAALRDE